MGLNALLLFFLFLCIWILAAILYKSIKSGLNIKKIFLICAFYALGFIFAWRQPFAIEKMHVLEYAVLGWLSLRDLSKNNSDILKGALYTFLFILITGSLDEGLQKLLPWRVFEIRDIATNVLSGILGISLFHVARK